MFLYRFLIIGGVHLVAHHVTELRKFYLTRAVCVVLQEKVIIMLNISYILYSIYCIYSTFLCNIFFVTKTVFSELEKK